MEGVQTKGAKAGKTKLFYITIILDNKRRRTRGTKHWRGRGRNTLKRKRKRKHIEGKGRRKAVDRRNVIIAKNNYHYSLRAANTATLP